MSCDDEKIKHLSVRYKTPPSGDGPHLKLVTPSASNRECNHRHHFVGSRLIDVEYWIREGETEVECGNCHTKLDPMFVLKILASEESRWMQTRKAYQEEMARLTERSRTKCDHCGKMTRISRR